MKKRILAMMLALIMVLGLAGCGKGPEGANESEAEGTAKGKVKLGFIVSTLDGVFTEFTEKLTAECKDRGFEFTVKEAASVDDKISTLENFTLSGCNVILIQVDDKDALQPYLATAQEKGVKIIALDTDTDTSDAFFGCKNYDYGKAIGTNAANWINETFDKNEKVEVAICNAPFLPFLVEREKGVRDALKELAPNSEIVAEAAAGANIAEGVTAGETWLQSNPNVKVVVAINDTGALGVCQAFKAAGKTGKDIGIFGGDAIQDACKEIKEGGIYRATVSTEILNITGQFVDTAAELVEKGKVEKQENYFPLKTVDKSNVDEYLK